MAYISATDETETATATSYTVGLPAHASGDLLLVFLTQDVGGTTIAPDATATTAGWVMLAQARQSTNVRHAVAWVIATSSSMTAPTFTGANNAWLGAAITIKGASATPFGSIVSGTDYLTSTYSASTATTGAITTATAGCLILHSFGIDGGGNFVHGRFLSSDAQAVIRQTTTTVLTQTVACTQQQSAGAVPQIVKTLGYVKGMTGIVCAVRNAASGSLQPIVRPTTAEMEDLYWYGTVGAIRDSAVTWQAAVKMTEVHAGTAQAGAASTITLDAGASAVDSAYNGLVVAITSGTGSGQSRVISAYVGATKVATVAASWTTNPDATSVFSVHAGIGTYLGGAISCSGTAPSTSTLGGSGDTAKNWGHMTALVSAINATSQESAANVGVWTGGTHTISSTNMSNKIVSVNYYRNNGSGNNEFGNEGTIIAFSDGTNWAAFNVQRKANGFVAGNPETALIAVSTATPYATGGTINWAAVTRVGYFWHRISASTVSWTIGVKNLTLFKAPIPLTGGGATRPATFADFQKSLVSWQNYSTADLQGAAQVLGKCGIQIGDGGTNTTYFDAAASSFELPGAYSTAMGGQMAWNGSANIATLNIKAGASDTVNFAAGVAAATVQQNLAIDAASSTSATYSFAGTSFVGWAPTWKTGINPSSATFKQCGEIDAKGSDWTDCIISKTTSTDAAIAFSEDGGSMTRCTIDVTGTSAAYHLELGTAVTAIELVDVTFTGTPATDKVHVRKTTGTVTITISGTTSLVAGDVTTEGATVSIVAPTLERGQNFTGLVAGSKVKVFTSGTQTVLYGTDSSGTTFAWDDATAGSVTVDYTIQQAGYIPIRVTGVVLTGAVGTGQIDTPISQTIDRAYVASSGLTYGTTAVVTVGTNPTTNPGTKTFQLTTASTGQNWYSFWIEQWIDKGDTGEALANVAFPLAANGPNSFSLTNGWTFSDGATSIANLSRDGLRYLNTSGVATAIWAAILTVGVPSGARVRYQQSDGGTTQQAAITSGNMDELVQIMSDPNGDGNYADGYDRRGYLVLKVQESGYDQIEANAISLYGNLEDQLYVVGLAPTANGIATGDPALTITITDHGATPVTWNGKGFSITITDNATPSSGTNIMRELRYNFEVGGTYQGKDAFNWHDLVQTNGSDFKTVRGAIYGDVGSASKGVRVVQNDGTTAHPDFTLFTADDGTTYAPPQTATITISSITSGSRVQIYDTANSVELFNGVVAATSKVFTETYSVNRTIRVRITYVSGATAKEMIEATVGNISTSSYDISYIASQVADDTYNTNAIDGSTVTGITINDSTDRVEIAIAGGAVTWASIYAYQVYWLNTATGIQDDFAFIEAPDTANYILTSFKIKNTHATNPLTITGGWGRDATTGLSSTIVDTTSTANIYLAPDHVIPYSTGSGLTAGQDSKLTAINSVCSTFSFNGSNVNANIEQVNTYNVIGTGQTGNEWRPA